jgi:hypothetical protein
VQFLVEGEGNQAVVEDEDAAGDAGAGEFCESAGVQFGIDRDQLAIAPVDGGAFLVHCGGCCVVAGQVWSAAQGAVRLQPPEFRARGQLILHLDDGDHAGSTDRERSVARPGGAPGAFGGYPGRFQGSVALGTDEEASASVDRLVAARCRGRRSSHLPRTSIEKERPAEPAVSVFE